MVYLYCTSWGLFRLEKQKKRKTAEKQNSEEAVKQRSRKAKKQRSRERKKSRKAKIREAEQRRSREAGKGRTAEKKQAGKQKSLNKNKAEKNSTITKKIVPPWHIGITEISQGCFFCLQFFFSLGRVLLLLQVLAIVFFGVVLLMVSVSGMLV